MKAFLAAYKTCGNVSAACHAARVGRTCFYSWLKKDADFCQRYHEAGEDAADALELEARRRACAGSDVLLIFLLKGLRPEKFRERFDTRVAGPTGGAVEVKHQLNHVQAALEEYDSVIRRVVFGDGSAGGERNGDVAESRP